MYVRERLQSTPHISIFVPCHVCQHVEYSISRVSLCSYLEMKVQDFLHEIDRSGGIYYFRWGDAPIHTVILQLFADICVVMPLCDISYYHSSTGHLIKKCTATNEDPEPYLPSSFFERK